MFFTAHVLVVLDIGHRFFIHGRRATGRTPEAAASSLAYDVSQVGYLWKRPATCYIEETGQTLALPGPLFS